MRIGLIGGGVVGKATARSLIEHVDEVLVHDIDPKKSTHNRAEVLDCDLVMVCLPTPQRKDSLECDTSLLEKFFEVMGKHLPDCNLVLRSTVPVGFTRQMAERYKLPNLVHSPEFLTARCSLTDAHLPSRNIIGTPGHIGGLAITLQSLYERRFPGVPCIMCSSDESELIKLATNGFFATKISYFNRINWLCDKMQLNWGVVLAGILADGRISHSHTTVPGPDKSYGYGGECLPKDAANLANCLGRAGICTGVIGAAVVSNSEDRGRK